MSMNTKDYKTKTMVVERDFPCRDNYWAVGLDIGYSAVKGISPARHFCFPAYAKRSQRIVRCSKKLLTRIFVTATTKANGLSEIWLMRKWMLPR